MPQSRREFLQLSSAAALGLAAYRLPPQYRIALPTSPPLTDPTFKELAMRALDAAKSAGAEYADVRISQNRNQAIQTREHRVQSLNDSETFGFGVRVLRKLDATPTCAQPNMRSRVGTMRSRAPSESSPKSPLATT